MMYYGFDKKFDLDKKLVDSLILVYGIGRRRAEELVYKIGGSREVLVKDVGIEGFKKIILYVEREGLNLIGVELERANLAKKKTELKIKSYRGMRKLFGLPVNGQRTKTNAKTARKSNG